MDRNVTEGHQREESRRAGQLEVAALRRAACRAPMQCMERLEGRQMLAADPFDIASVPAYRATTSNIKDIKHGPLGKGGQALVNIYNEYTRHLKSGGNRYRFTSSLSDLYVIEGRDVLVTIRATGKLKKVTDLIKDMKGRVVARDASREMVQAFLPIDQVDDLAAYRNVLHVRPNVRGVTGSMGSVGNDAERSHKTEFVLPAFGVDGTGQKVGVISDTFDARTNPSLLPNSPPFYSDPNPFMMDDIGTGDLPSNVEVLYDEPIGTNEGRAMLQLVHDIAPGAGLAFHSVGSSLEMFAQAVYNLREAGSTVIVDDISFATSPYFGEGVLEKAINDVVDDGAVYLTHQRNTGDAAYAAPADWVADRHSDKGGLLLDFDPSSKVDTKLRIKIEQAGNIFLQWDDVYDGTVSTVTADVDFYLYRGDTLITSSIDDNFATGAPYEVITVLEPGYYDIVIRTDRLADGAAPPTYFKFSANGNQAGMFDGTTGIEYAGNNSSAVGQSAARGAIAVAAVDNVDSNAFGRTRGFKTEDFSSYGPVIRLFDPNGDRLETPETILAPLVSGIQRTSTSVAGFEVFPGTSAAAPNVAAVVALLRQISPSATPDQLRDVLVESAKTQPVNGAQPGEWDPQGGYGLVDAIVAAHALNPNIPVSTFSVPLINSGKVGSVTVRFSEPVEGVDITDFTLTRDGTSANRFRGGETVRTIDDGTTWVIENLSSATKTLGTYTLTLRNNRTDIVDEDDNVAAGNVVSFSVTLRKVQGLTAHKLNNGDIRLAFDASGTRADKLRITRATDPYFSQNVRNIDIAGNSSQYIDTDVQPGEAYYYRVRGSQGGRLGDVASTSIIAASAGEIFVDQSQASFTGGWATYEGSAFLGHYARASATKANQTPNTATFSSSELVNGEYFVYVRYPTSSKAATNARFEVLQGSRIIQTLAINQQTRGDGWVLLGKFVNDLTRGQLAIRLTSDLANGSVTADAIRFLPAGQA